MRKRDSYPRLGWLKYRVQHYWLPLVLGFVATIAVLGLWQQLLAEEQLQVEQLVQQQVNLIQVGLEKDLTVRVATLERMAKRWAVAGGTPKSVWEISATSNVEDFPGLQAIAWIDSSSQVQWVVPQTGSALFQTSDLSQVSTYQRIFNQVRTLRQPLLTPTVLSLTGEKGFFGVVPLFATAQADGIRRDRFDGFLLGFFATQTLFDSILPPASQYQVQISDDRGLIYQQGEILPSSLSKRVLLQAYGREWQVQVALTSHEERSLLPTVILWGGLASAWIIALVVYLGQRSERLVRQSKKINQQLKQQIVNRQQIEHKLRCSEVSIRNLSSRLKLAVESAQIGIWDWDIIDDRLIWNDQMYELYGLKRSDFSGMYEAWATALHPDDFELTTTAIQQAIQGERKYEPEFRVVHPDGTIRFIQAHAVVQRDAQGQAQRMIGVNFDITEHKQSELVLKASEAKYRQLVNHVSMGFVVHAPDTHILQCNETACQLLGLSMNQMLGKEAIDLAWHFLREDGTVMPVEEYPVNRVLSTQVPLKNYVLGIHRGTQSQAWVLVTAFPEFDANNHLKQIVVTFIDITLLKRAETELREMAEVMENAISGISKLDAEGRYLYVNKNYADITGYQPEEMIGMGWQRTVHPDDLAPLNIAYQQMRQDGKVEVEARGVRRDGSSFYKQLVMVSAYNGQQQFVGHYCFMKDISDRKQAEEALEKELLRSKTLLNTTIDGIVVMNHQGNVLQTSPSFAQMLGYSVEATLNLHVADWDAQWTREELMHQMGENGAMPPIFETRHRRKDGSIYDVEISYSQVRIDGAIMHFCICRDISERKRSEAERKQAEIALQNSQARFAGILEIASDAIISVNCKQQITLFNQGAERIFGYTAEEVLGQPLALLMPDRFAQAHHQHINHYAQSENKTRQMAQRGAIFGRRKDGTEFPAEASISKLNIDGETMFTTFLRDISDRKRIEDERKAAEEKLRQSEATLMQAQRMVHLGNWELNVTTKQITWSDELFRMFGFDPNDPEPAYAEHFNYIHPDDRIRLQHNLDLAMSQGEPYEIELRILRRDGTIGYMEARGEAQYNYQGQIERLFGTALDITEHKQAELALQESEQRFQAFMQNAPFLAWIADTEGRLLYANAAFFDFIGSTPITAIGKPLKALFPEKLAQRCLHNTQLVLETGTVVETIEDVSAPDGRERECLVRKFPIQQQDQTIWVGGVAFDVTDQRQAEWAVRQSEERFRQIAETIQDVFFINTPDLSQIDYISPAYETIWGRSCDSLVQHPYSWLSTVHPDDRARIETILQRQLAGEPFQAEYRIVRPDGSVRWIFSRAFPKVDEAGDLVNFIGLASDITERKQSELNLRDSEEKFRQLAENIHQVFFILSTEGEMLYISPVYEQIWQRSCESLYADPRSWLESVHAEDLPAVAAAQNHQISLKQPYDETYRIVRPDGEIRWISCQSLPLKDDTETVIRFIGIAEDITERKQTEEALRQSEVTKQAIIAAIPDLLIRMRADGSYVDFISDSRFNIVNPAHIRQDAHVQDILPPDLAQLRLDYSQRALASSITQLYEQGIVIEGKQRYEEVRIVALLQNEVLIMVRDITDRKQAEEELRRQKEMFQVIVDNIPVMIALFNDQGRIDFINPEFERTLGWSLEEWQQRDVMVDLYPDPIYLQSVLDHMTAAMGNWKDFTTLTATKQQIETSWTNVPISKGRFLGIGQDITDRKRKETALQQAMEAAEAANLAKSMFLANMSHELRTPLNVILGFAQVMSHDLSLTPSQRDDLQTIQRSSDHLLSLINDVLDLSKIEAGHYTLEESGFDLISLLHTLRTMMIERAKTKRLQLTFEIMPEVPQFIIADEQKLRQVLLNLLSNAIKFTKQGIITLRVTSWESSEKTCLVSNALPHHPSLKHYTPSTACTLQFEVADTGVGIAVSEQEAIFDAFTQAEAGRKSISGTGLGLTITRRILELMGGNISVESTPGMGSTFTVTVPVCPTSGVDGQVEHQERTVIGLLPGQPHRRILVVDDQQENRQLMVRLLTHLGLDVREANSGQEAITLWQQWKPDLTWMDIRMPGLDGYEATKQIRAMEQEQASIIIALTAQASQSDRSLALAAGCNDYVSKPFREETLFLKLKEYLGLEYLYAEEASPRSPSVPTLDTNADHLSSIDPAILAQLSADWLKTLEDLALSGNDRAIVDLANQLAPQFDVFKTKLLDLVNRFEFEQIIHLLHYELSQVDAIATPVQSQEKKT